jgi:hypothetical protein
MPEAAKRPRNPSLWLGLAIAFAATLCNVVLFLNPPAQSLIPWLSLVLGIVAVVFIALGVKNLFTQSRTIAVRVLGVFVALLSLLFAAGSIFIFVHARAVPPSTDAPQIGQKAPDFTLPDFNNQPLSLMQLFAPAPGNATVVVPNAVLLVFYRGYW